MSDSGIPMDDERVAERSGLLEEERRAGTDDARAQAQAILEESEERTTAGADVAEADVEQRRSEDTVEPT
jgi:hypothetical protein